MDTGFQGKKDPLSGHSYIRAILDYAFREAAARDGCMGESLLVRQKNSHTHDIYAAYGFVDERTIEHEDGKSLIEMRKPVRSL